MITASRVKPDEVTRAIDRVLRLCRGSQRKEWDGAVELEIKQLEQLRSHVRLQWPLSSETKRAISIGSMAAKNLEDWNLRLARELMDLQYVLLHDGDKIERLVDAPAALARSESHELETIRTELKRTNSRPGWAKRDKMLLGQKVRLLARRRHLREASEAEHARS